MGFPLAEYPVDARHVEAFAIYAETGSPAAVCQLTSGPLDGGPACREIVWSALTLMARLGTHCRMADGGEPNSDRLSYLVGSALEGAWSRFFLNIALSSADFRTDIEENPIEVAVRSENILFMGALRVAVELARPDIAMASLLRSLLWLTLLCSTASGRPPGELLRSLGRRQTII